MNFGQGAPDFLNMDPNQLKQMLSMFGNMSDDQIKQSMKAFGIDLDPSIIRQFVDKLKNSSDDDIKKFKEQFKKGNVNMKDFNNASKDKFQEYKDNIKKLNDLKKDNKFDEITNECDVNINKLIELKKNKKEDEKDEEFNALITDFYDLKAEAIYLTQNLDECIKQSLEIVKEYPNFSIYKRMGICYFKKGRHVKARDAFLKAKELYKDVNDELLEKYLKMALEEIENY